LTASFQEFKQQIVNRHPVQELKTEKRGRRSGGERILGKNLHEDLPPIKETQEIHEANPSQGEVDEAGKKKLTVGGGKKAER